MSQKEVTSKRHMGLKAANRVSNTASYILLTIISIVWLMMVSRM